MALHVYSTLAHEKADGSVVREKQDFAEVTGKKPGETVTMYVCGPTVYKPSHIGHMVGPVIFDTVKRYLTYLGYKVKWVVNITDVDDKLIKRAGELNTTVPALAEQNIADYFACLKALNIAVASPDGVDEFPRATQHVGGMRDVIAALIKKGYAYELDDGVYFDVSKDSDYGKLSNRDPEQMEAGTRLEVNAKKRNPGDFALWKGAKPDEPSEVQFDSPFKCGRGRPGWHIECTCMAIKVLGETLDIHGGGLDLQFPHHENELAQSESLTGKEFAHVWMHNGLLKLKDKDGNEAKMAGSLGNVLNVCDALRHVSGDVLRFFLLQTHYRSPVDLGIWDWKNPETPIPNGLIETQTALQSFYRFFERYQNVYGIDFYQLSPSERDTPITDTELTPGMEKQLEMFKGIFSAWMDDDFNTAAAIGVLYDLVRELNRTIDSHVKFPLNDHIGHKYVRRGVQLLRDLSWILGLFWVPRQQQKLGGGDALVAGLMQLIIDVRSTIRAEAKKIAAKDDPLKAMLFAQATKIREDLEKLGVIVEDRPGGTTWRVG